MLILFQSYHMTTKQHARCDPQRTSDLFFFVSRQGYFCSVELGTVRSRMLSIEQVMLSRLGPTIVHAALVHLAMIIRQPGAESQMFASVNRNVSFLQRDSRVHSLDSRLRSCHGLS